MKHGAKRSKVAENAIIASIYFVIFAGLVLAIGEATSGVFLYPTVSNVIMYILGIVATIVFLILFLSAWDKSFGSESYPDG